MRPALGCSVLLAVLVVTGCGSSEKSKRRDAVNAYLGRVQKIQLHYRPSFDLANQAYRDFSRGKTGKRQVERRFLLSHQPNVSQAQHNAVKAYDNRLVGISKLQGTIAREHQRLQNLLS